MEKRIIVCCENCADFIKPQASRRIKEGICTSFEVERKHSTSKAEKSAYIERGNCPFLGCTRRICKQFIGRDDNERS